MTGQVNPQDLGRIVSGLLRRVETLERLRRGSNPNLGYGPAIFNLEGSLSVSTSDPDVSSVGRTYTKCGLGLTTAGSTSTTVAIKVGGATVETLTLASSATADVQSVTVVVPRETALQVAVTGVGTGAAGLVVRLEP